MIGEESILGSGPSSTAASDDDKKPTFPSLVAKGPKPNVRLSASQAHLALPEGVCNIGMASVEIPSKESQLSGFYCDDPGLLVGQFHQYKFIQEKGQPNDQHIKL